MENKIVKSLNSESLNPYYIYAPSYVETSAGVKVLHLLCHHLNIKGYPAFIANTKESQYKTNPNLITPIANQKVLELHKNSKKTPIVIYPDIVKGNPLNAKCQIRYLLHYAGLLGGDRDFRSNELIFTYTKKIWQKMNLENPNVLFIPICDTKIFFPPQKEEERRGTCFYASKYKLFSGKGTFEITKDSFEITRDKPDSLSTKEVADLLRKSEIFYSYEDTSLITEAILCGCPVVLVKNDFFDGEPLAINELGSNGTITDSEMGNINKAINDIGLAQDKFLQATKDFYPQLDNFIKKTQEFSLSFQGDTCEISLIKEKRKPLGRIMRNYLRNLFRL
jgi:hypothetical protein